MTSRTPSRLTLGISLMLLVSAAHAESSAVATYRDPSKPVAERVEDLLKRMTLQEKLGQLSQSVDKDSNDNLNNVITEGTTDSGVAVGSMIVGKPRPEQRNAMQRIAVEQSRLGIPILFGNDIIHGASTIYPTTLASACSFNPEMFRQCCAMAARETKAGGIDWTFSPMVDVSRDARWGRNVESAGEDVLLNEAFSIAAVRGYQGDRPDAPRPIVACLKHFVGYGASEAGRDYCFTEISPQTLAEVYLPPFEAGVKAGALTVMSAFNDLNGVPASGNRYTLTDILRGRLGFSGFVVSDWKAVAHLEAQAFAKDHADAARLALHAGVDMDMVDGLYVKHLPELLASGKTPAAEIDEAVRRILRVKFLAGLFEKPYTEITPVESRFGRPEDLMLARKMAEESFVLLKNKDGLLPLDAAKTKRLAIIGPLADDRRSMLGSWAGWGREEDVVTILAGLRAALPSCEIRHAKGCEIKGENRKGFDEAVAAANASDVVVLCVGEDAKMSGENASRATLDLPGVQEDLVRAVLATGKPVVLLISSGRPITIECVEGGARAIMAVWQPGSRAGDALANVLLGAVSPSGKLAMTWPRSVGQVPIYYAKRQGARPGSGRYVDASSEPRYPFGHGLSYSTFEYSKVRLSADRLKKDGKIEAVVSVTNRGAKPAKETVLWYLSQKAGRVSRPMKQLKHFEKAELAPGETREFRFAIEPARDLAYPDERGVRAADPGLFSVRAGTGEPVPFTLED